MQFLLTDCTRGRISFTENTNLNLFLACQTLGQNFLTKKTICQLAHTCKYAEKILTPYYVNSVKKNFTLRNTYTLDTPLLHLAASEYNEHLLYKYIKAGAHVSYYVFETLLEARTYELIQLALRFGSVKINEVYKYEETDRHDDTVFEETSHIFTAIDTDDVDILKLVLQAGADMNLRYKYRNDYNYTIDTWGDINLPPLFYAIYKEKSIDVLQILVDAGADVNQWVDDYLAEHCPLTVAASLEAKAATGNLPAFKFLLKCGANINTHLADIYHNVIRTGNPKTLSYIIHVAGTTNLPKESIDRQPLILCLQWFRNDPRKYFQMIKLLIEAGADLTLQNSHNQTPLTLLCVHLASILQWNFDSTFEAVTQKQLFSIIKLIIKLMKKRKQISSIFVMDKNGYRPYDYLSHLDETKYRDLYWYLLKKEKELV